MSLFSPAQPERAEARFSPGCVLASLKVSTYSRTVRLDRSLAAALLNGHFEHPAFVMGDER
ncbi:MAG: hypothetical protein GDA67_11990 [Nitrospira sp. CR1.3]|nr:hypothetical protein [Nitrospira sp. CR1.3]